ncbi:MAG: hypothetical protein RLZZ272_959 [Actinomycetota bacterium]
MTGRPTRVVVGATLLAGAVGLVRQRRESLRARTALPPSEAPDRIAAFERLARWIPGRPSSVRGRALVALWASPLTIVGLALALAAGARPRFDERLGCFIARGVGGPSGRALALVGADANTVGQVVLARSGRPSDVLLEHEAVHVRQAERLGPLLLPTYVILGALRGYRANPLERAARLGAARVTGSA